MKPTRAQVLAWGMLAGCWCLGAGPAPGQVRPASGPARPASPYEKLDETRLATVLRDYSMNELLESLVKGASVKPEDVPKYLVLIKAKKDEAAKATTRPALRNQLLDEAIALQEKVMDATRNAVGYPDRIQHFRVAMDRVVTEGITKVEVPYAQRMLYFQGKPDDPAAVAALTERALNVLNRLQVRMEEFHERSNEDDEYKVTGANQQTESLLLQGRYYGAWIRFYRGMALPKDQREREPLLRQVIADAAQFANAEDNSSGVKYLSLLLSGMAARELGELDKAKDCLQRANNKEAGQEWQLRALFELAHASLELGSAEQAENAVKDFAARGLVVMGESGRVAVDMQSALLRNHLYETRAEAVKASDPKAAQKYRDQSLQALLDFIHKYPQYEPDFIGVIAPKYEGREPATIPPSMLIPLGLSKLHEKTPEALAEAERYLVAAANLKDSSPETKALALWNLGLVKNQQRKNLEAARYFRQLAQDHPQNPNAVRAALFAVQSLQGVLQEQKKEPLEISKDFAGEYVRALEVLLKWVSPKDPLLFSYRYELGRTLESLGRQTEAMEVLGQVAPADELYIPARYRILRSRVVALRQDGGQSPDAKRQAATALINDLNAYREHARQYKTADAARAGQVRSWAAESDLLVAELMNDPLNQTDQAIQHAQQVMQRWGDVPGIERTCQEFIIRGYLKGGNLDQAIRLIQTLKGAEDLVAAVVQQMTTRMEELLYRLDEASVRTLQEYRKVYREFAQRLYQDALRQKQQLPPDQQKKFEEQMYGVKQALAGAYEGGSEQEVAQALQLYGELRQANPADAVNVRGLARCNRQLKRNAEATKLYDELVDRLPERSGDWWRSQVERLEFALELYGKDPKALKDLLTEIRTLRFFDDRLGGYLKQFNDIEARVNGWLKAAAAAPEK